MPRLTELESPRAYECRLTPDRALRTLDEAHEWLLDRGLLTLMPCCSLPSLFAACHEEPYSPHAKGFGGWPKTKWRWAGALERRPDVVWLRVHKEKGLLLAEPVARLADPLAREGLARAEAGAFGEDAARIVAHLAAAGPSLLPELREELVLETKALKRARDVLEREAAVVARSVVVDPHTHTSELSRWDQRFPEPSEGGLDELLVAGVRAAVVAPERELRTWFSWPLPRDGVDRLVESGRLRRVDGAIALGDAS